MSFEFVRVIPPDTTHVAREIMAGHARTTLRIEAEDLLAQQPVRQAQRRGYTPNEAEILHKACDTGVVKIDGLREIKVEDQTGRCFTHFIGDDEGAVWHQFANPIRIGKFGDPKQFPVQKRWWQK